MEPRHQLCRCVTDATANCRFGRVSHKLCPFVGQFQWSSHNS